MPNKNTTWAKINAIVKFLWMNVRPDFENLQELSRGMNKGNYLAIQTGFRNLHNVQPSLDSIGKRYRKI